MTEKNEGQGSALVVQDDTMDRSPAMFDKLRSAANLRAADFSDGYLATLLKMCVPAKATLSQTAAFLSICHQYDLNPLVGQVFLAVPDNPNEPPKVVTGRDTFIAVAERRSTFKGMAQGLVYEGEVCTITRDVEDPMKVSIRHEQTFSQGALLGAYCIVYDSERPPIIIRRFLKDYEYLFNKRNWRNSKADMIENRAIAAALRRMYSLPGLMVHGEEDDLTPSPIAGTEAANGALAGLQERAKAMAAKTGIVIAQEWSPSLVITEGKHEGRTWAEMIEENPKYVKTVARRRWLGLSESDAVKVFAALDAQEAPQGAEEPQGEVVVGGPAHGDPTEASRAPQEDTRDLFEGDPAMEKENLVALRGRARELAQKLLDLMAISADDTEEIEVLFKAEDHDGLAKLVKHYALMVHERAGGA